MDGFLNPTNWGCFAAGNFGQLNIDTNWACNLHCAYCLNPRSIETIPTAALTRFFSEISCHTLQLGCGMEPTMDGRLPTILTLIRGSKINPVGRLVLQTNGLALSHYPEVDILSLSLDTIDDKVFARLRGGSSVRKVLVNAAPYQCIRVLCTVTSLNIDGIPDLVDWAESSGVDKIVFRQVFHGDWHPDLVVSNERFFRLASEVKSTIPLRFVTGKECREEHRARYGA